MIENKKILYLYTGDHPIHRKFAESVGCKIMEFSKNIPKNYDIYFVEGEYARIVKLKKLNKINKNAKIIVILSDPRLYYLNSYYQFNSKKNKVVKSSKLKKFIAKRLLKNVNGVVCVGQFEEGLLKNIAPTIPSIAVDPLIIKKTYHKLIKIKPNLNTQNILFIGNGPDYYYKGIDILLDIFKEIKKIYPKSKLRIIGNWKIRKNWEGEGIYFEGSQKDISKYLKDTSLYLHLARGEAYGITILEAMLSGVPCIVSNLTGAKETVKNVDLNFIVPLEKNKILNKIKEYFNLNIKEKNKLSNKFRKIAEEFKEEEKLKEFKLKFKELIKEI